MKEGSQANTVDTAVLYTINAFVPRHGLIRDRVKVKNNIADEADFQRLSCNAASLDLRREMR
jgi:hypothetical protein